MLKDSTLSSLLENLLREKSQPLLNIQPHTSTAREAAAKQAERQPSESDVPRSESTHPLVVIAEGIIVRFKSFEIQTLARKNLPPSQEVIAELEAALGEELVFRGAMINDT